jgi:acetylglutamate kinase
MISYGSSIDIVSMQEKASTLVEALPYLQKFAGRKVVVKVGGEVLKSEEMVENIARSLILLRSTGIQVVVCHGGGPQISEMSERLGLPPRYVNGNRVTCSQTRDVMVMTMLGTIAPALIGSINKVLPCCVGISGIDSNMISVVQADPELGYVGLVDRVKIEPIEQLLHSGYLPVITPIGIDSEGQLYNINGDTCAASLAKALGAEKLILLSNIEGIYESFPNKESLISEIDLPTLKKLKEQGLFSGGMLPKVNGICDALEGGVSSAHILDGRQPFSLLLEVFTTSGIGTMIFP